MSVVDFPDKDSPLIAYQMDVCGRNAAVVAHYAGDDGSHELARAVVHFLPASQVRVVCTVAAYSGDDLTRALLVGEAVRGSLARAQRIAVDPQVLAAADACFDLAEPRPFGELARMVIAVGAKEAPRA